MPCKKHHKIHHLAALPSGGPTKSLGTQGALPLCMNKPTRSTRSTRSTRYLTPRTFANLRKRGVLRIRASSSETPCILVGFANRLNEADRRALLAEIKAAFEAELPKGFLVDADRYPTYNVSVKVNEFTEAARIALARAAIAAFVKVAA